MIIGVSQWLKVSNSERMMDVCFVIRMNPPFAHHSTLSTSWRVSLAFMHLGLPKMPYSSGWANDANGRSDGARALYLVTATAQQLVSGMLFCGFFGLIAGNFQTVSWECPH